MRLRTAAATVFATAILLGGAASTASAGEITGNGKPTQGPAHANSICVFSGLEDGDGAGFPGPGGAPPQNWGHSKEWVRLDPGRAQSVRLPARRLLQRSRWLPGQPASGRRAVTTTWRKNTRGSAAAQPGPSHFDFPSPPGGFSVAAAGARPARRAPPARWTLR